MVSSHLTKGGPVKLEVQLFKGISNSIESLVITLFQTHTRYVHNECLGFTVGITFTLSRTGPKGCKDIKIVSTITRLLCASFDWSY